jgi:hypothetical protein
MIPNTMRVVVSYDPQWSERLAHAEAEWTEAAEFLHRCSDWEKAAARDHENECMRRVCLLREQIGYEVARQVEEAVSA